MHQGIRLLKIFIEPLVITHKLKFWLSKNPVRIMLHPILPFALTRRYFEKSLEKVIRDFRIMNSVNKLAFATTGHASQKQRFLAALQCLGHIFLETFEDDKLFAGRHAILGEQLTLDNQMQMPRKLSTIFEFPKCCIDHDNSKIVPFRRFD